MYSAYPLLAALAALAPLASAHGYLSSPPPRGIDKATYSIDALKSPNFSGKLCRGEPEGKKTHVKPGQTLRLGLTITAPHVGPCRVTILDANLKNERPVAEKMDCAAPGGPGFWNIDLPSDVSGHQVLRWYWEGRHVSPGEPYEQCIDLVFDGQASYEGDQEDKPEKDEQPRYDTDEEGELKPVHPAGHPKSSPKKDESKNEEPSYTDEEPASYNDEEEKPQRPHRRQPKGNNHGNRRRGGSRPTKGSYEADAPAGGQCNAGAYRCTSSGNRGFQQCANGQWASMQCAEGTQCRADGEAIVCA